MGYHDDLFPEDASYGTRSSPRWSTSIIKVDSGSEERVARWSTPHYIYHVGYRDKTLAKAYDLDKFFIARNGAENSFPFKDWRDHASTANGRVPTSSDPTIPAVAATDVLIGTGNGTQTQFQLVKNYVSGPTTQIRPITKPKLTTTLIAFNGTPQGAGWTVDPLTGLVTFSSPVTAAVQVTAGFEYYIQGRLGDSQDKEGLGASLDDYDNVVYPQIEIVEDVTTYLIDERFQLRGAGSVGFSADVQLSFLSGHTITLVPTAGSLAARLPDATLIPQGGPIGWLANTTAFTVAIRTSANGALFTLPAASGGVPGMVTLLLGDVAGVPTWFWT